MRGSIPNSLVTSAAAKDSRGGSVSYGDFTSPMNFPRSLLRSSLVAALLALAAPAIVVAQTAELAEAKTRLLELYQNGRTDSDNSVKQLKEKIAALEYVA